MKIKPSKPPIYIFAGGKSSRFGGNPKILETFSYNKELLDKYFNVFIVTSKDIYEKIKKLQANFIIQEMGKGSGNDVFALFQKMQTSGFVCWSDVFFSEENVKNIIAAAAYFKGNCMTGSKRDNPYISLLVQENKVKEFKYNEKSGVQDNSIFFINSLKFSSEEFMDMAIMNNFQIKITNESSKYFNTKEDLNNIKKEM